MSLTKETASIRTSDVAHQWYIVDLKEQVLGRAAVKVANLLRGRNKPQYTPNADTGDFVVVINAAQVLLTGRKLDKKVYRHHSNHVGGLKEFTARAFLQRKSDEAFRRAVWGMLPKGPLGRQLIKKLKVYPSAQHPHEAQSPITFAL